MIKYLKTSMSLFTNDNKDIWSSYSNHYNITMQSIRRLVINTPLAYRSLCSSISNHGSKEYIDTLVKKKQLVIFMKVVKFIFRLKI